MDDISQSGRAGDVADDHAHSLPRCCTLRQQPFPTGFESERGACFQRGLSLNAWLGSVMMRGMVIDMNELRPKTVAQLRASLLHPFTRSPVSTWQARDR